MILEQTAARSCRLLSFLRQEMQLSSGLVKRLKWQNALFLNGAPAHTSAAVRPGDRIRVCVSEEVCGFAGEAEPIEILYEDEALLAVDKPAGLLVHPSPQRNSGTLANFVLGYFERSGQPCGVHPVTRLDRDTFGVVLFAKNAYVHEKCCAMQRDHRFFKTYHAAVFGGPRSGCGLIDLPIRKVGNGSLLRTVSPEGKAARTRFTVLSRTAQCAVLRLEPVTGRTHQLRVHCLYAGFPILGDPQYRTQDSAAFSRLHGLTTQELCARQLEFPHPLTGAPVRIESRKNVIKTP